MTHTYCFDFHFSACSSNYCWRKCCAVLLLLLGDYLITLTAYNSTMVAHCTQGDYGTLIGSCTSPPACCCNDQKCPKSWFGPYQLQPSVSQKLCKLHIKWLTLIGSGTSWVTWYHLGAAQMTDMPKSLLAPTDWHSAMKLLPAFRSCCYAVFTSQAPLSAVYAMALCLSVASQCSTEMAKCKMTQTTPHDSAGTLVFWYQRSFRYSNGVTPNGGNKCRWGRLKLANFDKWLP